VILSYVVIFYVKSAIPATKKVTCSFGWCCPLCKWLEWHDDLYGRYYNILTVLKSCLILFYMRLPIGFMKAVRRKS